MQWNLEKLYEAEVKGNIVPRPGRLRVLGEGIELYKKEGEEYIPLGNIDDDFYNETLSKYIKLGTSESTELRKVTSSILTKNKGNTPNNLNSFQSYVTEGGFTLDTQKLEASESFIIKCISENAGMMLDDFLKNTYGEVDVYNQYFTDVWSALPAASVMGRAGTGELFLAFFCNGSKPEKGDLRVGSEDIEVKGFNGRLFKSKKIDPRRVLELLIKDDLKDETQLLRTISYTIGALAGIESYKAEILDLISQPEIKPLIIEDYNYLKAKGWLPNLSTIMKIAGVVQMLAYKTAQKFDSMIAFNDKVSNGIWLQFINLKDINSLADIYNRLMNLPSKWRTSPRIDGFGFSLKISPK
jgi:hypothetical protein